MNLWRCFPIPFMQRALIAGVLVSLCCALLGVSPGAQALLHDRRRPEPRLLRRPGHRGGLGFTPLYFSIPVVILAAFFLLRMASHPRWNSDAAIAVMSASSLAMGIIVIS